MIDATRFPETTQYLASLPEGLESYPESLVKTDARTGICAEFPDLFRDVGLPPIVKAIVSGTYTEKWMPEVVGNVIYSMVADAAFSSGEALDEWTKGYMTKVVKKPLYRALIVVLSPTLLIMGVSRRWASLHQGSQLLPGKVEKSGPKRSTRITLTYPPHLFGERLSQMLAVGYGATVELAGAKSVVCEHTLEGSEASHFDISWDD